ncbi:MAG: hypothetical protein WCJ71_05825 [Candidatus Omnitrophota bacterium]
MGLDVHLHYKDIETGNIDAVYEITSTKYPEHMFTMSYYRSSYNGDVFNNFCRTRYNNEGLYYIFDLPSSPDVEYIFPNWQESLTRANLLLSLMKKDPFKNINIGETLLNYTEPQSFEQAIVMFKQRYYECITAKHGFGDEHDFLDNTGVYSLTSPMPVLALLPITRGDRRSILIVTKSEEAVTTWYEQATEIVIESITRVLKQPDPENYCLGWSY